MGRCTRTSAAITSIAVQPTSKTNAWLHASLNLRTLWRSSRSPPRDSGRSKRVHLRTELRDEGADGAVKAWDGSRCHFTQECLEFAVRHLDGTEVGRIFRQVTQCRAHCFDSPANAGPQMDPAVIHHDDVVASERRNQAVFDIGEEH